jgi:hypothetical protein
MSIGFDYDLGEIVRMGYQEVTLKEAVVEYIRRPKDRPYSPSWMRARGKFPGHFEAHDLEALAKLPAFRHMVNPLPQRE